MVRAEGRELPGEPSGRQNHQGLAFGGFVWGGRVCLLSEPRLEVEPSMTVLGSDRFHSYIFRSRERDFR